MADLQFKLDIQRVFLEAEQKANDALENFKVAKLGEIMSSDANSVDWHPEGLLKTDQRKFDAFLGGDSGSQKSSNALSNSRFSTLIHRQSSHLPNSFDERVVLEYEAIVAQPAHENFSVKQITALLWGRLVELAQDPDIKKRPSDVIGSVDGRSIQLKAYPNKSVIKKNISDRVSRLQKKARLNGDRY